LSRQQRVDRVKQKQAAFLRANEDDEWIQ
jgi:hypothetical protein